MGETGVKHLVITGASSGIGLAIASRFLRDGWAVTNLSRRPCPRPEVETLHCDLTDPSALAPQRLALESRLADASRICLVHNAAILHPDRIDALPDEQLRRVLELSLLTPNTLNQWVLPLMGPGSSLIYIGSTLSEKAVPGAASYVIAKHALVGMMRASVQDLAGRGVHSCILCPGFTDTEQVRALIGGDADTLAAITALNAFNRLIEPAEIAEAVAFAAESPILNGAVIHANLGQRER